ncbi:MAG TPA: FG-GAP-like repeat-containing protein [Pyrinomonadaceae bacterium]|jgi:uncharacterized delta-60 repeat protein
MNYLREKLYFDFQRRCGFFTKITAFGAVLTALILISTTVLNAATGLDTSFGTEGKTVMNGGAETAGAYSTAVSVTIDPANGKIYSTGFGRLLNVNNTGVSFARLNADGTPDTTFGANGRRLVALQDNGTFFDARGRGIVVLADGSAIAVGNVSDGSAIAVKLTSAGVLDSTFGSGGLFVSTFGAPGASLNAVALQADGTLIAVGGTSTGNFVVAKLTSTGALDAAFGSGGFVTTDFNSGNDVAASVALQPDGKIVVGGNSSNDCAAARYNANGSLDTSFGTNGKVVTPVVAGNPDNFSKILLQPDGKIVGLGIAAPTGFERHLLVRYNANGTIDNSFGVNGIAGGYFGNSQEFITGGVLLPNGKIVAVGFVSGFIGTKASVARYNADGSVDRTFLCSGLGATFINGSADTYSYAAALQSDGKIVAAGQGTSAALPQNSLAYIRYLNSNTPTQCAANDFERDGKSDLSVFRPSNATWYLNRSSNPAAFGGVQFGLGSDKLAAADYDGDGRTDIAVWRESEGNFYILQSTTNAVRVENFGLAGDVLTVGDWDGDGRADLSVYRSAAVGNQSYFYYRGSLNNPAGSINYLPWGISGDKPLRGDFDGDGRQDAAVYRAANQTWYIRNSSNGQAAYQFFGLASDSFVPADYDGDGKTDAAVFRPSNGTWYILQSSNNQAIYQQFGLGSDLPAPADYDGDGRADIAVFRNGAWFILQSSNGQIQYPQFGQSGDIPIAAAFTP